MSACLPVFMSLCVHVFIHLCVHVCVWVLISSCLNVLLSSYIILWSCLKAWSWKSLKRNETGQRNVSPSGYHYVMDCQHADIYAYAQTCRYAHNRMIFPRSTTLTEEFSTFQLSSSWLNKNCLRWNLSLFSELSCHFLSPSTLIKVSTFQGWWRGAVQRCFPSFQQGRRRYSTIWIADTYIWYSKLD